uniref:Polyubiquitin n=1 Tax=Anthurium amnicola TaxID=1678845 RepID=A0A1D1YX45_9ARAE
MDLSRYLQCTVCRDLKTNPRETQCCHKLFCQDCIQSMNATECPVCRQTTNFVENPLISQLINNKLSDDSTSYTTEHYSGLPFNLPQRIVNMTNNYLSQMNPNSGRNDPDTGAFRITVLTLEEKRINIYVEPSDTIKILKLKVQRKDGILPEHQRLIFGGKQLEDVNTISDYKIGKDNTIHLVSRYNSG